VERERGGGVWLRIRRAHRSKLRFDWKGVVVGLMLRTLHGQAGRLTVTCMSVNEGCLGSVLWQIHTFRRKSFMVSACFNACTPHFRNLLA
jgi:hypothetical protein